jgi:methionine aminotransferase
VILNNPHNPACVVHGREDMEQLACLLRGRECYVLADEVYEHVLCDGRQHASVLSHPELRTRSFAVFSFGKTLHATGWRVGYCVAPPDLTTEFRKVHQFNTFTITTPLQVAIARYLEADPESWIGLPVFFQRKRDRFLAGIEGSGFRPVPAQGTYFQLLDFAPVAQRAGLADNDVEFADRMIRDGGLAPIPLSPFYRDRPRLTLLRFCIAKREETLDLAARKLREFAARLQA